MMCPEVLKSVLRVHQRSCLRVRPMQGCVQDCLQVGCTVGSSVNKLGLNWAKLCSSNFKQPISGKNTNVIASHVISGRLAGRLQGTYLYQI